MVHSKFCSSLGVLGDDIIYNFIDVFVIHYCKTMSCLSFGHFPTARILTIFVVQNCLLKRRNLVVPNKENVNNEHYDIEFENYAMARKVYNVV